MNPRIQHGNDAKIDPKKDVVPRFLTNTIVSKQSTDENSVPHILEDNVSLAKDEVDQNHK